MLLCGSFQAFFTLLTTVCHPCDRPFFSVCVPSPTLSPASFGYGASARERLIPFPSLGGIDDIKAGRRMSTTRSLTPVFGNANPFSGAGDFRPNKGVNPFEFGGSCFTERLIRPLACSLARGWSSWSVVSPHFLSTLTMPI